MTLASGTPVRAYALALVATMAAVALTRFTWPLFAATPFAAMFAAVAITTHWGSGPAGLVALALAVLGSLVAFPAGGPAPWDARTLVIFVPVSLIANRIVAGRNRTAAALRASEAELRVTWEHAVLGAALLDRDGNIERINPALERLLGYSASAIFGAPFTAFNEPDDVAAERQRFAGLMGGTDAFYRVEQRYCRRDGTMLWGCVTVSAIRGADGAATGALAVLEDVTARRQAESDLRASEETLRRAQKMEAVGQLVAGVAHNFNNLLTVTMGYTEILRERHAASDADVQALEEIRRATERGAALTRQLLAFGRKYDASLAKVDLNRAVAAMREILTRVIREDIHLTIEPSAAPAAIVIDPHDLEQVILNLVINARDALPAGGTIHVGVERTLIDAASRPAGTEVAPGEYVRLRVRDDGVGMTPEVQAHLFEPFFTTKEVGEGTGMGLAFVDGIARHGRGFVTVDTAPGLGTTVSVYFPPTPEEAIDATSPPESSNEAAQAAATILLVEDEAPVRMMTTRTLERAGYRVLPAATPAQACALFERDRAAIDLLVTDIVMPDMHGTALAERLVGQRPDLPVLFVSGYSDAMPAGATRPGAMGFLAKPFPSSRLIAAVAELLTARAH
jgi:two-component system cell cycle sensor histidine kinase/response regulator CckA